MEMDKKVDELFDALIGNVLSPWFKVQVERIPAEVREAFRVELASREPDRFARALPAVTRRECRCLFVVEESEGSALLVAECVGGKYDGQRMLVRLAFTPEGELLGLAAVQAGKVAPR